MEKPREQLLIEPDFEDMRLEETADIPERIASELVIDGEEDFLEPPKAEGAGSAGEEIAALDEGISEPVEIKDDFSETELRTGPPSSVDLDLLSIAAEIDSLAEVKRVVRTVQGSSEGVREEGLSEEPGGAAGLDSRSPDELLIHEDDDIDLDYYSLDDISDVEKREPDERGRKAGKDIERFEMLEPALDAVVQSRAKEPTAEISKAPAVQIEEPVFDEPERAAKKAAPGIEPRDEAAPEEPVPRIAPVKPFPAEEAFAIKPTDEVSGGEAIAERKPPVEEPPREVLKAEPPRREIQTGETHAPLSPKRKSAMSAVPPEKEDAPAKPGKKKGNIITIEFPDALKEKMPEDLGRELGEIDLSEAEKIANENILLLTEKDLMEELSELDLAQLRGPGEGDAEIHDVEKEEEFIPPRGEAAKRETGSHPREADGHEDAGELRELVLPSEGEAAPEITESARPEGLHDISFDVDILEDDEEEGAAGPAPIKPAADREATAPDSERPRERQPVGAPGKDAFPRARLLSEEPEGEPTTLRGDPQREALPPKRPAPERRPAPPREKEHVAPDLLQLGRGDESILFIDDELVAKEDKESESIFKMGDLEKITAEIVEVIEGKAMELKEADAAEDLDKIAGIMRGTTPAFEDLLSGLETEYAFKDDDVEFIDNAFTMEDFGDYLKVIDDLSGSAGEKQISTAVELLGLDANEIGNIEQNAFLKEYDKLNVDEELERAKMGFDQPISDYRMAQKFTYLTRKPAALRKEDRKSIEEDISSDTALIYEEDIDEISRRLNALKARKAAGTGEFPAIGEKVVKLENANDVDRFIASLPKEKQERLRMLFKYLDGLFERLPEDVIKKFAESEYFDLYSKVLSDLGE